MPIVPIKEIREKFPNPTNSSKMYKDPKSYCVGGALCLFITDPIHAAIYRFPCNLTLAEILEELNPNLRHAYRDPCERVSLSFARLISTANDHDEFELAWKYAQDALLWSS